MEIASFEACGGRASAAIGAGFGGKRDFVEANVDPRSARVYAMIFSVDFLEEFELLGGGNFNKKIFCIDRPAPVDLGAVPGHKAQLRFLRIDPPAKVAH